MAQAFIHLSDPHLSSLQGVAATDLLSKRLLGYLSWRRRRRHEHRREILDALTADFADEQPCPVVVTGDLTHIGLESEFRAAAAWLASLGPPERIALVPGNHDATVSASLPLQRRYLAAYLAGDEASTPGPTLRVRGELALIGLDSAIATAPGLATGRVDDAQLAPLPSLLADCRAHGLFRVVYLHHCPLAGVDRHRKRLVNAAAVADAIAAGGAELVLHGHGHRDQRHSLDTGDGPAPVLAAPSASARGARGHPPAAYHRLSIDRRDGGWSLVISTRGFGAGGAIETLRREQLTLSRSP
jgi:3',5'-cyclic AMP phosphodiesterase CpdA